MQNVDDRLLPQISCSVMSNSDPPKLGPMGPNLVAVLGPMGPNST